MDIKSVESSMLLGELRARKWQENFEAEFYAPVAKRMVRLLLQQLTPAQMRLMQMANPEALEETRTFSGIGGK
jgi:hypothetical protein